MYEPVGTGLKMNQPAYSAASNNAEHIRKVVKSVKRPCTIQ